MEERYPEKVDWTQKALKEAIHTNYQINQFIGRKYQCLEYTVIKSSMQKLITHPFYLMQTKIEFKNLQESSYIKQEARVVNNRTLHTLNNISIVVTGTTLKTKEELQHFIDYCATNPETKIIYRTSDIQLMIDSDASCLVALKSRSRET